MPIVVDFIAGCLDAFFAASELGMKYVGEIPKNDEIKEKTETVFARQVILK